MLGSAPLESVLGAAPNNRDHEAVRAYIRQAADLDLSVLFIYPNSKMPADMRTSRQRNAEDKAAQLAAQDAGRKDWARAQSPAGLALATSDKAVLDRYLKAYVQRFSKWVNAESGEEVGWSKKAEDSGVITMSEPVAVNLAVEVGGSGVVVVDCDTAGQMARWYEVAEIDLDHAPAPTIITPGHVGGEGDPNDPATWAHSDGGHFWFTVPDRYMPVLPRHFGAMTWGGDNGFAVLWDKRYVLIPPSTRPEGRYDQLGGVYDLPDWLATAIIEAGARRVDRSMMAKGESTAENPELAERVDEWASQVSWSSILEPLGWVPAPRADSCGCAVWTAPGPHSSAKSATAHDAGCSAGRYTDVNAPLHLWTDNPGAPFEAWMENRGSATISKLQTIAEMNYGGSVGKAMDELGITPDLSIEPGLDLDGPLADLDTSGDGDFELPPAAPAAPDDGDEGEPSMYCTVCEVRDEGEFMAVGGELWHRINDDDPEGHLAQPGVEAFADESFDPADLPADYGKADAADSPYADQVSDPDPDVFDSKHTGVPRIAPFSHWRGMPPPEYIIEGLIEHGGLSCLIGPPGIGKSTIILDMLCHIVTGKRWQGRIARKTKVLYLPGEGLSGAVQRIRAWEVAHGLDLEDGLLLGDGIILVGAQNEAWGEIAAYIARHEIGLVVFDTFARMANGLEENSATDVGKAVRRFDKLRELTNAGVCVVHHTAKGSPDVARGSSALNGALDSELLARPATWDFDQLRAADGSLPGKPIEIWTSKQKNSEQLDQPIPLLMRDLADLPGIEIPADQTPIKAPVITSPSGSIDPMQGEVIMARPPAEPIVETAIRIRIYVDGLTQQGASRSDLVAAIRPDAYARGRADVGVYWKQRIGMAVDRGLRYQLIETLTGTASGSRYIPSVNDAATARGLAAAEVINDQD